MRKRTISFFDHLWRVSESRLMVNALADFMFFTKSGSVVVRISDTDPKPRLYICEMMVDKSTAEVVK